MDENRMHCKHIATELEKIVAGDIYRCPECGQLIEWRNGQYNGDDSTYTCQECNAVVDECDLEAASLYDYFTDNVYDVEFRIGSDKQFRSVRIMVACGGPNIFIDTAAKAVQLYWWTDKAEYLLDDEAVEAVNAWAEEWYNC